MAPIAEFTGFPEDALQFLRDLAANNRRDWFRAQRKRYDEVLKEPGRAFVSTLEEPLHAVAPEVQVDPRLGGSLLRQERGVALSSDQKPYRERFTVKFWQGTDRERDPGFYLDLGPDRLEIGAGVVDPRHDTLERFRAAAADGTLGPLLTEALDAVMDRGDYKLGGRTVELPDKFDPENPRADLVARDAFYVRWHGPPPADLHEATFVDWVARHYRHFRPAYDWLIKILAP